MVSIISFFTLAVCTSLVAASSSDQFTTIEEDVVTVTPGAALPGAALLQRGHGKKQTKLTMGAAPDVQVTPNGDDKITVSPGSALLQLKNAASAQAEGKKDRKLKRVIQVSETPPENNEVMPKAVKKNRKLKGINKVSEIPPQNDEVTTIDEEEAATPASALIQIKHGVTEKKDQIATDADETATTSEREFTPLRSNKATAFSGAALMQSKRTPRYPWTPVKSVAYELNDEL
eukprot:gnl/TRDRNA2_/TRDRNA2_181153_c0_seq1.p1 gnl/TRDRNA2_/TRDRNA2_181153_c0~~gnl/TRDRNA2_/TRDRNA2_181153_c0_seq1.p1  ORF type:complete len:232 (-),score=59.95 gnl/TRDRNA2_/TRDRNA2_181153_c0_seq1:52-747(-)